MHKFLIVLVATGVICCLLAGSVAGDRLLLIPTGDTLTTGGIKAEYAAGSDNDGKAYWLSLGISRIELEVARFQDFGPDEVESISAQIAILPETSFTPSLAIGARDISDETDASNALYDGQSFYLAASKSIPITGGVPFLFEDMKLHGGIGTGSLSGVFLGVEGRLPMGIHLAAEYDTEDFNIGASYRVIPAVKVRVSSIRDDVYYGAQFSTSF